MLKYDRGNNMLASARNINGLSFWMKPPFKFSFGRLSDEQFENVCRKHPDLQFELSAKGELIIMPPTLPDTGWKNSRLTRRVGNWTEENNGVDFDSSTIFTLKNGAKRSPDVAWITLEKWNNFSDSEKKKVSKITPDFVIELRSSTDSVKTLQAKMREYIENGVKLGWLIDPDHKKVHIYRANGEVEVLQNPETLDGEDILIGFRLNVQEIF
jgi:Uma2 family endonuclease